MRNRQNEIGKFRRYFLNPIIHVLKNWKNNWGSLFIIIIPVLFTFPLFQDFINRHWLIPTIGVSLILFGWIQSNYHIENTDNLYLEIDLLNERNNHLTNTLEGIPIEIVRQLYNHWKFGYSDRISIYRYEGENFVQVGRYSKNIALRKDGRRKYPTNEGFIGKALHNGEFHIDRLPDYDEEPDKYINDVIKKAKINKGTIRNISMKSRSFFCKNLTNQVGDPIAVVVIESLKGELPVSRNKLKEDLEGTLGQVLVTVIELNLPIGKGDRYEKNK